MADRRLYLALSLALAASTGCGSGNDDCTNWCGKVYDTCGLALNTTGGAQMSKAQCVEGCKTVPQNQAILSCMNKVPGCDQTALTACLTATPTAPKMGHPYTPPPQCLSCHGAGTSSNAKKVPASHAGRTDTQCPTCHQPGG